MPFRISQLGTDTSCICMLTGIYLYEIWLTSCFPRVEIETHKTRLPISFQIGFEGTREKLEQSGFITPFFCTAGATLMGPVHDLFLPLPLATDFWNAELLLQTKHPFPQFQPLSLGLLRSDYLANFLESNAIKQVEVNTIASSFGGISTFMTPMHRYNSFPQYFLNYL